MLLEVELQLYHVYLNSRSGQHMLHKTVTQGMEHLFTLGVDYLTNMTRPTLNPVSVSWYVWISLFCEREKKNLYNSFFGWVLKRMKFKYFYHCFFNWNRCFHFFRGKILTGLNMNLFHVSFVFFFKFWSKVFFVYLL